MILFRLFMHLLKPSDEQLKKKSNGTFIRMCIQLYQSILKYLLKSYKHYAILDIISIDSERIKIVHEFRDLFFEHELMRNGINIRPHLLSKDGDVAIYKGRSGFWFKYFKWKDLKSIYIDNNELFIKHDNSLSINSNATINVKSSSEKDIIFRSIIELKTIHPKQSFQMTNNNIKIEPLNKGKEHKEIFKREGTRKIATQNNTDDLSYIDRKQSITKRGFEIDTTF